MNPNKFLMIILAVTFLASFYVHQQLRIVQLAYEEQEKLAYLGRLLDENNNLKYSINHRTSLVSIARDWQSVDFEWPHREQLVSLSTLKKSMKDEGEIKESESIFARLFRLRSQAEATPVKPR